MATLAQQAELYVLTQASTFETEQDSVGLLGTETFLCPCLLFVGNRFQPP